LPFLHRSAELARQHEVVGIYPITSHDGDMRERFMENCPYQTGQHKQDPRIETGEIKVVGS